MEQMPDGSTVARPVDDGLTNPVGRFQLQLRPAAQPTDSTGAVVVEITAPQTGEHDGFVYSLRYLPGTAGSFRQEIAPGMLLRNNPATTSSPASTDVYLQVGQGTVSNAAALNRAIPKPTHQNNSYGEVMPLNGPSGMTSLVDEYGETGGGEPAPAVDNSAADSAEASNEAGCPEGYACYNRTSCFDGDYYSWQPLTDAPRRQAYVPTKFLSGPQKATGELKWKWTRSHETTTGFSTKVGDTKYVGGTFMASRTQRSDATVSISATNGAKDYLYQLWTFEKERQICHTPSGFLYWIKVWRYRPLQVAYTYETQRNASSYTFKCQDANKGY